MANVTLKIDDDILKTVRKIAVDRNTTLSALIREYLDSLVALDREDRRQTLRGLEKIWESSGGSVPVGRWTREELHER
ncbi:MAG TPA: DUF6364 family protein [Candidatus Brocadiia bacterium]|nr:DUF6364 family protein [Candidatus Brocadiia bacterium]